MSAIVKKKSDTLWYKDAIIYQLHVQSYFDSNDDGIGDFNGLVKKLDYLKSLGVTALWLLPFYPSPLKDGGYDISDYSGIHPSYGTLADFRKFIREAHNRDLKVITELVLNHTSNQHKWFQKAREASPRSSTRNFYVWNDSPDKYNEARIIFQDFESSNWSWDPVAKAYYWHRFYSHQPDLNFENPAVHKAVFKILDFWFDIGVDGLRLDAVPYLYEQEGTNCENLPETHKFLKMLRAYIDEKWDNRMLLAEANQWPEDSSAYFGNGDECHMAFNFPLMPRLYMSMKMEDYFPIIDIMDQMPEIPGNCQWAIFLRNHDELTLEMVTDEERDYMYKSFTSDPRQRINLGIRRRLAPLLGNDIRKIEIMNMLLFSLPGTPIIYYGDEIGMGDNHYLGDRDGVRTPMQWSPNKNAGFSNSDPQRLFLPVIINYEYHYEGLNVDNQERNQSSLLWWMRRVIAKRKQYKAFSRGSIRFLNTGNPRVLSFIREYENEKILVLINLSRYSQIAHIELSDYAGYVPVEVFSQNEFPEIETADYYFPLQFKDYFWFELKKTDEQKKLEIDGLNFTVSLKKNDWNRLTPETMKKIEDILLNYISKSRWFRGKARKIKGIEITDTLPVNDNEYVTHILMVDIGYFQSKPETYLFPVSVAVGDQASHMKDDNPHAVLTNVDFETTGGVLYDGVYNPVLQEKLFELIVHGGKLKGKSGTISGKPGKHLNRLVKKAELPLPSHVVSADQSNTSILYDNRLFYKIYRSPEEGKNPEIEILKFLTEKTRFKNLPSFAGSLEYSSPNKDMISLATLAAFIPNQGNAWELTQSFISEFFNRISSSKHHISSPPDYMPALLDDYKEPDRKRLDELIDHFYLEMVALLGKRTAEMHLAIASVKDDRDFVPEPFSLLYQKSMYQTFRTLVKRTFTDLRANRRKIPENSLDLLDRVLDNEAGILEKLKNILATEKISSMKTRIHGDYHLGQVLFTGKDFIIIDFEGEPIRSLSARKLKYCPFRDVAGMLRSFHYAVYMGLQNQESLYPGSAHMFEPWVEHWYKNVSYQFLHSYLETAAGATFIPREQEHIEVLIRLFVIEKAIYETDYEMNNRPDWIRIPLNGLSKIVEDLMVGRE